MEDRHVNPSNPVFKSKKGISPFGTRQKLQVVMEESILKFEKILINAGQRGTMLKIAPGIIRTVLACTVADVAQK